MISHSWCASFYRKINRTRNEILPPQKRKKMVHSCDAMKGYEYSIPLYGISHLVVFVTFSTPALLFGHMFRSMSHEIVATWDDGSLS